MEAVVVPVCGFVSYSVRYNGKKVGGRMQGMHGWLTTILVRLTRHVVEDCWLIGRASAAEVWWQN